MTPEEVIDKYGGMVGTEADRQALEQRKQRNYFLNITDGAHFVAGYFDRRGSSRVHRDQAEFQEHYEDNRRLRLEIQRLLKKGYEMKHVTIPRPTIQDAQFNEDTERLSRSYYDASSRLEEIYDNLLPDILRAEEASERDISELELEVHAA